MFIYSPVLLMQGPVSEVLLASFTAFFGVAALSAGVFGWFGIKLRKIDQALFVLGGLLLFKPGLQTDLMGLIPIAAAFLFVWKKKRLLGA